METETEAEGETVDGDEDDEIAGVDGDSVVDAAGHASDRVSSPVEPKDDKARGEPTEAAAAAASSRKA